MLLTPSAASCELVAGRLAHVPSAFAANVVVVFAAIVGSVEVGSGPQLSSARFQPADRSTAAGTESTCTVSVLPFDRLTL